jgi:hypothetical protein
MHGCIIRVYPLLDIILVKLLRFEVDNVESENSFIIGSGFDFLLNGFT